MSSKSAGEHDQGQEKVVSIGAIQKSVLELRPKEKEVLAKQSTVKSFGREGLPDVTDKREAPRLEGGMGQWQQHRGFREEQEQPTPEDTGEVTRL